MEVENGPSDEHFLLQIGRRLSTSMISGCVVRKLINSPTYSPTPQYTKHSMIKATAAASQSPSSIIGYSFIMSKIENHHATMPRIQSNANGKFQQFYLSHIHIYIYVYINIYFFLSRNWLLMLVEGSDHFYSTHLESSRKA